MQLIFIIPVLNSLFLIIFVSMVFFIKIMNLKYLHFILFFFGVMELTNCSSKKYLSEVPYRYSSEEEYQAISTQKTAIENQYTNIDDKEKYAVLFGVMPKEIKNYDFYAYIDPWLGTPYRKQSLELQKAVDCSYFVQALYSDVFQETFPKTPDGIFRSKALQLFTGRTFLQEGDLIFFRYDKHKPISDVGIYLHNDRILACSNNELNIFNFNNEYFQLRYIAAGRLKPKEK